MAKAILPTKYDPRQVEMARYEDWKRAGYFRAVPDPSRTPWAVMMPLPNVTGELHIGHALNNGIQDVLTRFRRMLGFNTLYQPGTDHAGIATQNVVERELTEEGLRREDLGREKFEQRVWAWVEKYGRIIYLQLERLGISCDWDRKVFTLDPAYYDAVLEAFVRLYDKGLIYRGKYMVNWCPRDESAISDLEVEYEEVDTELWYVRYRGADGGPGMVIATQRPETMLADVAVAVHPDDTRYRSLVGTEVIVPIVNRRVPVITDRRVEMEFGTGAVKITPGHDPLDYEIGRDHQLPTIVVLDPKGRMTPEAGKYVGLDRFAARRAVGEDLNAQRLVEKVEPYRTNVGHCDRCHAVIEPYISDQWFCDMKAMARRAAEAIRSGRVRFYPERWTRVALDWLENIRPWTISRQLWWGHRIPIYQCDACGERVASKVPPALCRRCGSVRLTQESDVLDTWFSSALWPFATLGWPTETEDLRYFYPTSVLVTDRGIIFLWVCRMIMFGQEFMHEVPFRDVCIHPTVLTLEGKRMSKSLGTGIDPLEMADGRGYGADAVRFALLARAAQTQQDMRFGEKMIEDVRNFNTKIWNATRFLLMNLSGFDHRVAAPEAATLSVADRWIRSRYARLVQEVTTNLEAYEFDKAAKALYDFIWSEYCDWYLEMAKVDLQRAAETSPRRAAVQHTLWYVLSNAMLLLHPIMPFLTEEVWQRLPHAGPSIMIQRWPQAQPEWIGSAAEEEMELVMEVIRGLRSLRAELSVPPGREIRADVYAAQDDNGRLLSASSYIKSLAKAGLDLRPIAAPRPAHSVATVLARAEIHLALGGLGAIIDIARERERLRRAMVEVDAELQRLRTRLDNKKFLERAPTEVVARERERATELEARRKRLAEILEALGQAG